MKDMTEGKPGKLILWFAIPLMLGNIFQQLYTFADTVIVGKCLGVNALAALGATEWLIFLLMGCVQGISQGFSIGISQSFGKHDEKEMRGRIVHSGYLSIAAALILSLAGIYFSFPVLRWLHTPWDIIGLSHGYLRILYLGTPVCMLYNFLAAVLRAMGDSRTPFKAVAAASVCNILLDVAFVMGFGWGIEGAGGATLLSQFISALYCLAVIRRMEVLRLKKEDLRWEKKQAEDLLKLGIPMGVQNMITAAGGVIVQRVINGFGILFIAGFTAANKLYGLLEIAASSYGSAVAAYTGQNMGAGRRDRIRQGLRSASGAGIATAYGMSFIMVAFGRKILGLFVAGSGSMVNETIQIGYTFLLILAFFFPLLYMLYILRACVQGMGDALGAMISSMVQLLMRVVCALFLTQLIGRDGVFWGEILAWAGADLLLLYLYMVRQSGEKKI